MNSYRVERLGTNHNRLTFISGVEALDRYFHIQAGQDARKKVAAPFILLDPDDTIVGYYTLSAYSIVLEEIPVEFRKRLPRYPLVPATLLGRLAISRDRQGQKLGRFLLMDALHRSWMSSGEVASAAVVVEALNEAAHAFYRHHEFIPLQEHENKLFLAMTTIEKLFK